MPVGRLPETFLRVGAGLVVLAVFIIWEFHNAEPMFDISLFARPAFGATSFAETVAHFALVGAMFGLTQYLQFVWGQTPLQAGISLLPLAFGMVVGSAIAARSMPVIGARYLIVAGMVAMATSLFLMSRLAVDSTYLSFAIVLTFTSLGMGLAMAPATDLIMGAVDKDRAGVGSATNDTTRELGSALGVAVFGSILSIGLSRRPGRSARRDPGRGRGSAARRRLGRPRFDRIRGRRRRPAAGRKRRRRGRRRPGRPSSRACPAPPSSVRRSSPRACSSCSIGCPASPGRTRRRRSTVGRSAAAAGVTGSAAAPSPIAARAR